MRAPWGALPGTQAGPAQAAGPTDWAFSLVRWAGPQVGVEVEVEVGVGEGRPPGAHGGCGKCVLAQVSLAATAWAVTVTLPAEGPAGATCQAGGGRAASGATEHITSAAWGALPPLPREGAPGPAPEAHGAPWSPALVPQATWWRPWTGRLQGGVCQPRSSPSSDTEAGTAPYRCVRPSAVNAPGPGGPGGGM